ncbi:MAG: hypothetical protein UX13_C0012G0011 [Candidatus Woesebacteria bacterium GW2011_GWB1_45_5]|uniref:Uncharacterized protein n=1 Tax=Candidatus Woesebacteria bacterium GW2011_GWB1_45_5 TaxID=1618581 RepID=A0A0G1MQM5_9BACT|nr:MAG: hypothetical protein UX13_C0012G0011 [Candidatus Woesebacteria bacterium GW2011_GWB1_45_5]
MEAQPQWVFSDRGVSLSIVFGDVDFRLLIHVEKQETVSIGIYDFEIGFLYLITRVLDDSQTPLGYMRPLFPEGNDFEVGSLDVSFMMKQRDKERMLRLMRKIASFRSNPMPIKYSEAWSKAVKTIQDLDLVNPGKRVFE